MELLFIGTGSGKTSLKRMHSSCLIRTNSHSLLIDSGDGIARSLMLAKICPDDIDSIVITHLHADHFSGLAGLLTQMKLSGRTKQLTIRSHNSLEANLISFLRMSYLFTGTFKFKTDIKCFQYSERVSLSDELAFKAKENNHITNKHDISKNEQVSFTSGSLLISAGAKNIFYTSDIGHENDLYLFNDERINYFISEATHTEIPIIHKAYLKSKADKLLFTHIDESKEEDLIKWHNSVSDKEKIAIAEDGLTIKL